MQRCSRIGDHAGAECGFLATSGENLMTKPATVAILTLLFSGAALHAQQPAAIPSPPAAQQTETDEYTRYELLAPETGSFKIYYEVTATPDGATLHFIQIR